MPDDRRAHPSRTNGSLGLDAPAGSTSGSWWPLLVVFLAACLPKLYCLDQESLWLDEALSIKVAERPWSEILDPRDYIGVHPPLYFVVLKPFLALSELVPTWRDFLVRLPAVLATGGLAAVLFLLGAQCSDRRLGWIAAGVSLPSAFLWHHGQECRMYTLGALLVAWQALLAIRAIERPAGLGVWVALLVSSVLAALTHWFALSLWLPLLCYSVLVRPTRRGMICTAAVFFSTLLVLSAYLVAQFGGLEILQTFARPASRGSEVESAVEAARGSGFVEWLSTCLRRLAAAGWCLWAGHGIGPSDVDPGESGLIEDLRPFALSLGFATSAAALTLWATLASLKRSQRRKWILFLLVWSGVGVAAPIIAVGGNWYPRYSFVALPGLLLLVAFAIREAQGRWMWAAIAAPCLAVQLCGSWNQLHDPARWNPDFRAIARELQSAPDERGRVACSEFIRRLLGLYGAADTVGFSYTRKTFDESQLRGWLSARIDADRDAVVIINRRWNSLRVGTSEEFEADFVLVDLRSWGEVEERRYRRKP